MASKNEYKASELFQAQANLYNQIFSFMRPMSIKWAVELGIPDIIHNHGQPITLPELVAALRIPESKATCVHSIMRLLAHNKVFTIVNIDDNKEAYTLAPTSKLLVKGTNHCLSSMVHLITDPNIVDLYYQLSEWTSNEKLTIHETTFWDYYHQNPNHLKSFNDAITTRNMIFCNNFFLLKVVTSRWQHYPR
jgi:isoflavone-7-O-methyltransferase